jgi:hypothetical protein
MGEVRHEDHSRTPSGRFRGAEDNFPGFVSGSADAQNKKSGIRSAWFEAQGRVLVNQVLKKDFPILFRLHQQRQSKTR